GFFDFTPVQGEILRCLIPQVPNVIVNLNHDAQNEEIFRPFQSTIDHLQSIAPFKMITSGDPAPVNQSLRPLRARLLNLAESRNPTVREGAVREGASDKEADEPRSRQN